MASDETTRLRFAQYYLETLEMITARYVEGGDDAVAAIAAFRHEADNIWEAQRLVLTNAPLDIDWAGLAIQHAGTGAALFLPHLDLRQTLDLLDRYLALSVIEARDEIRAMLFALRGIVLGNLGAYDEAVAMHRASIELSRRVEDLHRIASGYGHLGVVHSMRREFEEAEACYAEQETLARALDDEVQLARVMGNRAILRADLGDPANAVRFAQQAAQRFRALKQDDGETRALVTLGSVLGDLSQYDLAEHAIDRALRIATRSGDREGECAGLSAQGRLREQQKRNDEAEEAYSAALMLAREIGDRAGEAAVLQHLAHLLVDRGEYRSALALLHAKLEGARERGDRWSIATTNESLGTAYRDAGYHASALKHLKRAARLWGAIGNQLGRSVSLSHLGVALSWRDDHEAAIEAFDESAAIGRAIGSAGREARGLANGALCRWHLGQKQDAIRVMRRAAALAASFEPELAAEFRRHLDRWDD